MHAHFDNNTHSLFYFASFEFRRRPFFSNKFIVQSHWFVITISSCTLDIPGPYHPDNRKRGVFMIMQCTAAKDLLAVGYSKGELTIEFRFGGVYVYHGVPEEVYQDLLEANSQCMYFLNNIKDFYWFTRVR